MDEQLKLAMEKAAKLIQTRLQFQAPVKTGKLRDSIKVKVEESKSAISIVVNYEDYGIFTDSGTKNYFKPSDTSPWNKTPGKGVGGIKPRYWTNIDGAVKLDINKQIKAAVTKTVAENLFKI